MTTKKEHEDAAEPEKATKKDAPTERQVGVPAGPDEDDSFPHPDWQPGQ